MMGEGGKKKKKKEERKKTGGTKERKNPFWTAMCQWPMINDGKHALQCCISCQPPPPPQREFESHLLQHLCEALGVDKSSTPPYHPPLAYINERQNNWSDYLDLIMIAYRPSVHSVRPKLDYAWKRGQIPLDCWKGSKHSMHGHMLTHSRP